MSATLAIDSAILLRLEQGGPCNLDILIQELPAYSWNQLFTAIDRLSRNGVLTLQPLPSRFDYLVSIKPRGVENGVGRGRRRLAAG
ncbi:MAG: hypothetical protein HY205_01585 [Nitrospirae bacterium]|nr:hypothetical protein [Nitrospirota bacterium]